MSETKVFISVEEFPAKEFYDYIETNPTHRVVIWGPENVYVPQLYKTQDEWKTFSSDLDSKGIDYVVVTGCSEFYENHSRVVGWDDFAAYDVLWEFVVGNLQLSPSPNMLTHHFTTRFGQETIRCSYVTDMMVKNGIMDNTNFYYSNNGKEFSHDLYQPIYWDGKKPEYDCAVNNCNIPDYRMPYLSSALEISVEKDWQYPHITDCLFIPIVFGKPSICLGAKDYYKKVKKLFGIDMYTTHIDTLFDDESNRRLASDMAMMSLKLLSIKIPSPDALARELAFTVTSNLQKVLSCVQARNVNSEILKLVEIPELYHYKEVLNSGSEITFIGKTIY